MWKLAGLAGLVLLSAAGSVGGQDDPKLPAFPGAQGFGAETIGGRGGRVIKVTNLNASGPGSLQEACDAKGPRIVVFDVSGVIKGDIVISEPFVTIAGQTAPGAGITIVGSLNTPYRPPQPQHDIVVRFLRIRHPAGRKHLGDPLQFSSVSRAVLDHLSLSWAEDETIDLYAKATDITVQWCSLEESTDVLGLHLNQGIIIGPTSYRVSVHHNIFAHHARRSPAACRGPVDFRNNVIYNFAHGFVHDNEVQDPAFNLVGNYFKRGPSRPSIRPFCFEGTVPYHVRDNWVDGIGVVDPWQYGERGFVVWTGGGVRQERETPVPAVETHDPRKAYDLVLSAAGCFPRDLVTRRTVEEIRTATGEWGRREPKDLLEGLKPEAPPADTDGDGMADSWEKEHGLDPADPADSRRVVKSGYTAVEEYCNELAARRIEAESRK